MALMIPPFGLAVTHSISNDFDWTIEQAYTRLRDVHRIIADRGKATCDHLDEIAAGPTWGTQAKRNPVKCPRFDNFLLAGADVCHSLIEVVNMCATVERLLDGLNWARSAEFQSWSVAYCHQTQSSAQNNLVLVQPRSRPGERAQFEI